MQFVSFFRGFGLALGLFIFAALGGACAELPRVANPPEKCEPLAVDDGPEDFALDVWNGSARLLVSVHERRAWKPGGEINALDLTTGKYRTLPRRGGPEVIRPHGVDVERSTSGDVLLYVITHGPEQNDDQHAVLVYRVLPNELRFVEELKNPLLNSPNDLDALPDGRVFVGNDAGTRGSFLETALSLRRANLVEYDGKGNWREVAGEIAFTNGVLYRPDGTLIVAATRGNRLIRLRPGTNGDYTRDETPLADMIGPDNIMADGENHLLVAAHPDGMAFLSHAKDGKEKSSGVIFRVNIETGEKVAIFASPGSEGGDGRDGEISAPSTGLIYNGKLYMAQVFQPYILACEMP